LEYDAENSALHHRNKSHFKIGYIKIENRSYCASILALQVPSL